MKTIIIMKEIGDFNSEGISQYISEYYSQNEVKRIVSDYYDELIRYRREYDGGISNIFLG